ncbi:MAG: SusC/RagA family TonB-linked outer membrane protein [Bacteroidales bacterium]|nr:SusC/RagA family TonB-linked outer membrane protein [Bacteroidales bacterium]
MESIIKKCSYYERKVIRKIVAVLIFSLALSQAGFSQSEIRGTVTDENGDAMAGVTIFVKGTSNGTITDSEGIFALQAEAGDILQISFIGYLSEEVEVTAGMSVLDLAMAPDLVGLDEVVVIGYGTQRKSDVTSAITSVSSDEFVTGQVKDAGQLLQGKVAGLAVHNPSGNPLDGVQIMLRGISSLQSGYSPMVIVDGIPGSLDMVAVEDIETIDILKDGSAAAIYGTRGTNGVIIITTKKGTKNMEMSAEYNAYVSTQRMYETAPFYGVEDYRRLAAAGVDNFSDLGYATDWLDAITHNPFSQMHSLSIQGGSKKTAYVASVNYTKADGIFNNSYLETFKTRVDVTQEIWKDILSVNIGTYTSRNTSPVADINWAYRQAMIHNPTEPLTNEDGSWYEVDKFQYENPVALLEETFGGTKGLHSRVYGNVTLTPIRELKINLLLSRQIYNQVWARAETFNHISNTRDGQGGQAQKSADASENKLLELTGDYSKSFGAHRISIVGGYSYEYNTWETFWAYNKYFPTDAYLYNNLGSGTALPDGAADMSSNKNMSLLIGFFGRINYSYDGKYLLTASMRREGSSKFGENYQWGNFPSIQAGWRISQESFMENIDFVTDLKLRAGYGVTGIIPSNPYQSLTLLNYSSYIYYNGEWVPTIVPGSNPNPDLRWEKKKETNIGLDFAFLRGRVSGTVDYYIRRSEDLLYNYPVSVPPYLYSSILANAASMENKGIEALLTLVPVQTKNLTWTSAINFSSNKNKLVALQGYGFELDYDYLDAGYTGDPIQQGTHRVYVGEQIGNFWGYQSVDIDDRGRFLVLTPEGDTVRYTSAAPEDKMVLGNGIPKFYAGWNNTVRFMDFDLSVGIRGAFGFQILNFQRMFYENPTISYNMLETAHHLVYGKDTLSSPQSYVSYYIEDGDYVKIDNVTLGYTFTPKNTENMKSLRVYVSTQNLYTFTNYTGMDPEVSLEDGSILAPGNDNRDKYPTTRTFTVGLNVKF